MSNTSYSDTLLAATINLSGSWSALWKSIESAIGTRLTTLMAIIGTALVVIALVKWAWDRRRGLNGGGGSGAIWGALLVGALLSAPSVIIPIGLTLVDAIANAVLNIWNNAR